MTIHKLFTGTYCAHCHIKGFLFSGYGKNFAEAIELITAQIIYAQKIKII